MIAVLFEARPAPGRKAAYLELASALRVELERTDGFLSVERFESLSEPGKLLSLSFWRDEEAVAVWRNAPAHRVTQAEGRGRVFETYRLRVATILRDYGMDERAQAPADSRAAHPEARHARR